MATLKTIQNCPEYAKWIESMNIVTQWKRERLESYKKNKNLPTTYMAIQALHLFKDDEREAEWDSVVDEPYHSKHEPKFYKIYVLKQEELLTNNN
jgi:hypothetical protein